MWQVPISFESIMVITFMLVEQQSGLYIMAPLCLFTIMLLLEMFSLHFTQNIDPVWGH